MGLIGKIFGDSKISPDVPSKFQEGHSQAASVHTKSRNGARRDLVKLALRDTIRKFGVPPDWIDCRTLSVVNREQQHGMHVQFLVRKSDRQVMNYIHAFQESFWKETESIDPQARQWLFSVGWEFYGKPEQGPDTTAQNQRQQKSAELEDELASDLQALQALMSSPAELDRKRDRPATKIDAG